MLDNWPICRYNYQTIASAACLIVGIEVYMIILYTGTPGSGKSLHVAERIYNFLQIGRPCICNFPVAVEKVKRKRADFLYRDNEELTPDFLREYSREYFSRKPQCNWDVHKREEKIKLFIDEAQLIFNARMWNVKGRNDWNSFFTQHRHYGYTVYLICQFDRMLDRQIRYLVEDEYKHRSVKNMGKMGWCVSHATFSTLFFCRHYWYPTTDKLEGSFFVCKKRYYSLYDTHFVHTDNLAES